MDIDVATQLVADVVRRPVIVYDARLNTIAFSVHSASEQAQLSQVLAPQGAERTARMFTDLKVSASKVPVRIPAASGLPARIATPIRYERQTVGFLAYASDERPSPRLSEGNAAALLHEIGAILAARQRPHSHDAEAHGQQLEALLGGRPDAAAEAAQLLLGIGSFKHVQHWSVLVIRPTGEAPASTKLALAVDKIVSMLPGSISQVIDGEGTVLLSRPIRPADIEKLRAVLDLVEFTGYHAGVGGEQKAITGAIHSRDQARIALSATIRDPQTYGSLALWSDLGLDRVLLRVPLESLTVADFPGAAARLLDRDQFGPDLFHTMEVYLDCGGDAQRTAAHLHIHRSTLYYRLDRIREVLNADLSGGDLRFELHTALRIARLAGLR